MDTFCPASMCPLFAPEGSPWTGDINSKCAGPECAWFDDGHCMGAVAAHEQIDDVRKHGRVFQIGVIRVKHEHIKPKEYDCPRAAECQRQREAGDSLCPPRRALSLGIDPRACAY